MSPDQPTLTTARAGDTGEGSGGLAFEAAPAPERKPAPLVPPPPHLGSPPAAPSRRVPAAREPRPKLTRKERKAQYRLRARKVKRVIRRFDPWSVLKLSVIFYLCLYVVTMVAGVLLWNIAARAGVIDNIEGFVESLGAFETFEFESELILQGSALIGGALVVVATGLTVLGAVLFNLISDLVGGVRITVIEEDGARPVSRERKRPVKPKVEPADRVEPGTTA